MTRTFLMAHDLKNFKRYCLNEGFEELARTNVYEVLRMRKQDQKGVLIVYRRKNEMYWLTVEGLAYNMAEKFYNQPDL